MVYEPPRRRHRTRHVLVDEVAALPPYGPVLEQQYCAVLRRVGSGYQKLIIPEVIVANLPEKRAAAVWRFWFSLLPPDEQAAFEARV
jgi:hypothetical protein